MYTVIVDMLLGSNREAKDSKGIFKLISRKQAYNALAKTKTKTKKRRKDKQQYTKHSIENYI